MLLLSKLDWASGEPQSNFQRHDFEEFDRGPFPKFTDFVLAALCYTRQPYVTLVYSASPDAESYAENGTAAWTSYASRLNGAIIMTNFWTSTSYFLEIAPAVIWLWDVLGSP